MIIVRLAGHLLVDTRRSLEPQRLIEIVGARMNNRRRVCAFEGFKSVKLLCITLRVFMSTSYNDGKCMTARNPGGLPFTTTTRVFTNVDQVLVQSFFASNLKNIGAGLEKSIATCTHVNQRLNGLGNFGYEQSLSGRIELTTLCKPFHELLTNSLDHCEDWQFPCWQQP